MILAIAIAGCLLRLFFWLYTDRTWEDALITVLHAENFANGLGLTHHHPGMPPLHGFTSPLSVLVPLLADLFHPGWGIHLLKLASAFLSIPTVLLASAIARHPAFRLNIWLVYLLCSYLAFEHHQILWGMAGMETQFAVFALFLTLYCALKGDAWWLGASMALCIYTRPDFAILLLFIALYTAITNRAALRISIPIAAALYAPWLIFTTLYYGSPVPNPIVAKSLGYHLWTRNVEPFSAPFWHNVWARIYDYIYLPLGPSFAGHGSGFLKMLDQGHISHLCLAVILIGTPALLRRFHPFYLILVGWFGAYSLYYIFLVQGLFGWYLVPFNAVNCLLFTLALGALLPKRFSPVACIAYIAPFLVILPITFRAERDIQRYIETPVRMAIGRYLFAHKKPGEVIACEPLGYIAYYSRMPVYDYPGLASPEVTAFLKQLPEKKRDLDLVLQHFKPDWIALREFEYKILLSREYMKFIETEYSIENTFRVDPAHIGKIYRIDQNIDHTFFLLKKKS